MIIDKRVLLITSSILAGACSSNSGSDKNDISGLEVDKRRGRAVHVEVVKNDASSLMNKNDKAQSEFLKIFKGKKKWALMGDSARKVREFKEMSIQQLKSELVGADPEKVTLIVDALSFRGASGIQLLASLLEDSRQADFKGRRPLFWYEEKNKPAEPLEIRVYAALNILEVLKVNPEGVLFDIYNVQSSDLGNVEVLYAVQGEYALNKDALCKIWLNWWDKFKSDFVSGN